MPRARLLRTRFTPIVLLSVGIAAAGCGLRTGDAGDGGGRDTRAGGGGGIAGYNNTGGAYGGASGADGLSVDGLNCGLNSFGVEPVPPDLLIVLDTSGSMQSQFDNTVCPTAGTCTSKWSAMTTALSQVVTQTQAQIRWGLKLYANDAVCTVNPGAAVGVGPNTAAQIAAVLQSTTPVSYTPTRSAIVSGTDYLRTLTDTNPKFILLATDGLPNCAAGVGNTETLDDSQGAIAAVTSAFNVGFPTFVVGIGNVTSAQATLTSMAIAGGRAQTAAPRYYPADNPTQLAAVLADIGTQVASCTYPLGRVPPDPTNIAVDADGVRVPKDTSHVEGWDYGAGQASISLYGTWCTRAKSGGIDDMQIIFGCPGQIIP